MWSDRPQNKPEPWPANLETLPHTMTVLDAGHKIQWGAGVAAYLVTKGVAGGAAILAPFAWRKVRADWPMLRASWKPVLLLGLLGIAAFNALLYSGLHSSLLTFKRHFRQLRVEHQ